MNTSLQSRLNKNALKQAIPVDLIIEIVKAGVEVIKAFVEWLKGHKVKKHVAAAKDELIKRLLEENQTLKLNQKNV